MYGSVFGLMLSKITHEEDRVLVQGELVAKPGKPEIRFVIFMPQVDSLLDYFL
jgi:hypothetical protein